MIVPVFMRSRLAVVAGAVLLLAWLGLWGTWRWAKRSLPAIVRAQISAAVDRDVSVTEVDPWFTSLSVHGIRVARTRDPGSGTQIAAKGLVIRFWLPSLLRHYKNPARAIRRVELIEPYFELPMEALPAADGRGRKRDRDAGMPELSLPAIPRTYCVIKGGTLVVTRRGKPVAEVKRLGATLDLRDLPSVNGNLNFVIAPDSVVSLSGRCHLSLRNFEGRMSLDHLDLGQISDLVRLADPRLPGRLGGRLKAELEVLGGFMTLDELAENTTGRGSLEWRDGSLSLRGRELITGAAASGSLDGREIALEQFDAKVLQGTMAAAGSLGNLGVGRLRLRGRLDAVPVQALRALSPGLPENLAGSFNFEFSATGTGRAPVFAGRLTAPAMGVPGVMAEHVSAEALYAISEVRLTSLTASLWEGSFRGSGAVTGLDEGEPVLDFTLQAAGINVGRTPIRDRYAGRGELSASLKGPVRRFTGGLSLKVAGASGRSVPIGDVEATAKFEAGAVAIEARTASRGIALKGTIVLGEHPRITGGRADVQERLPVLLAVAGIAPPAGFEGRASGKILIEGPLTAPVLSFDAVGSAVRMGPVIIADMIRIPRFSLEGGALVVPDGAPLELEWGPEQTVVRAWGRVPFGFFTAEGKEPVKLHLETRRARLDVLKRLDLIKSADGQFDLIVDLGGTASLPVWTSLHLTGEGRRLVLKEEFFDGDFDHWKVDVRMKDSEADNVLFEFGVNKQRQVVAGTFGMNGWIPASADLLTETVAASRKPKDLRGLPLKVEDVGEVRARLFARLIKLANEDDALLTGPDPEKGAELVLSNGVITYLGGSRGGAGRARPDGAPPRPSPIAEWFAEHFSYRGTVAFEKNVTYAPASFLTKGAIKGIKGLFGDREGFRKFLKAYSSKSGVAQGLTEEMLAFDVKIKDGSFIFAEISPKQEPKVDGHLDLEPGGKVTFAYSIAFRLVDEPGLSQRIEFQPGERLEAHVSLVAETVLFDKMFTTDQGPAMVDEVAVRLVLSPPVHFERDEKDRQAGFLKYTFDIVAEPKTITGEVEVPADKVVAAAGVDPGADAEAVTRTRPVTFTPDKAGLMTALFGFDKIASAATPAAGTDKSTEAVENLKSTATTSVFNAVLAPLRKLFGLDVLSVRKSQSARRKTRAPANGSPGGAQTGLLASTLEDKELTIGKALTRTLFLNTHAIYLDAAALSQRSVTGLSAQQSSSVGLTAELEYRRSFYKLTARRRAYALPDDPKQKDFIGEGELFLGGEMSRNFTGVSQREPFRW